MILFSCKKEESNDTIAIDSLLSKIIWNYDNTDLNGYNQFYYNNDSTLNSIKQFESYYDGDYYFTHDFSYENGKILNVKLFKRNSDGSINNTLKVYNYRYNNQEIAVTEVNESSSQTYFVNSQDELIKLDSISFQWKNKNIINEKVIYQDWLFSDTEYEYNNSINPFSFVTDEALVYLRILNAGIIDLYFSSTILSINNCSRSRTNIYLENQSISSYDLISYLYDYNSSKLPTNITINSKIYNSNGDFVFESTGYFEFIYE